jgi:hypothetical protein
VYLLHGSPTSTFARIGQKVNVGDAVYTSGGNGTYSSGYHLHLEVHSSLVGQLLAPTGPGDDINPEPWLQYQGTRGAAASWGPNRLDLFFRGTDANIYHKWTGDDSTWYPTGQGNYDAVGSAGGGFAGQAAVASWAAYRLDLFGVGYDNNLWHRWIDASLPNAQWSSWENLSQAVLTPGIPSLIGTPSAVSYAVGALSVFIRSSSGAVVEVYYPSGGPWNWQSHDGSSYSDPIAIAGPNRIDLVVYGRSGLPSNASGYSWHQSWTPSGWSPSRNGYDTSWGTVGAGFVAQPGAALFSGTNIDFLGVSGEGYLWDNHYDGASWSGWQQMIGAGGPSGVSGSPSAAVTPYGALFSVLVRGTDGALWDCWPQTRTNCHWNAHGGQITNDPLVVSAAQWREDVFVRALSPFYPAHQLYDGSNWIGDQRICMTCYDIFGGVMA